MDGDGPEQTTLVIHDKADRNVADQEMLHDLRERGGIPQRRYHVAHRLPDRERLHEVFFTSTHINAAAHELERVNGFLSHQFGDQGAHRTAHH